MSLTSPKPVFPGEWQSAIEDPTRPPGRRSPSRRGEAAVGRPEGGTCLALSRDDSCTISAVRQFPLHCNDGILWVTWPEYPGDAIVSAGERLVITSRRTILVTATCASSIWVPAGFAVEVMSESPRRRLNLRRS